MSARDQIVVPDIAGEIIGYRAWLVDSSSTLHGPRLVSPYEETEWPPDDWLYATCKGDTNGVPHERHMCGIYAAVDREQLARDNHNTYGLDELLVIGEVALAGKYCEGSVGWRAARARPVKLLVPYEHWELLASLHRTYQIPVELDNIERRRRIR